MLCTFNTPQWCSCPLCTCTALPAVSDSAHPQVEGGCAIMFLRKIVTRAWLQLLLTTEHFWCNSQEGILLPHHLGHNTAPGMGGPEPVQLQSSCEGWMSTFYPISPELQRERICSGEKQDSLPNVLHLLWSWPQGSGISLLKVSLQKLYVFECVTCMLYTMWVHGPQPSEEQAGSPWARSYRGL